MIHNIYIPTYRLENWEKTMVWTQKICNNCAKCVCSLWRGQLRMRIQIIWKKEKKYPLQKCVIGGQSKKLIWKKNGYFWEMFPYLFLEIFQIFSSNVSVFCNLDSEWSIKVEIHSRKWKSKSRRNQEVEGDKVMRMRVLHTSWAGFWPVYDQFPGRVPQPRNSFAAQI